MMWSKLKLFVSCGLLFALGYYLYLSDDVLSLSAVRARYADTSRHSIKVPRDVSPETRVSEQPVASATPKPSGGNITSDAHVEKHDNTRKVGKKARKKLKSLDKTLTDGNHNANVTASAKKDVATGDKEKLILLWTGFWNHADWGFPVGNEHFKKRCGYKNCATTTDKSRQKEADLVLFNCRNRFASYPSERHPGQIYTMFCSEALNYEELFKFDGHINMTATYRRDSDVYAPYYRVVPRPPKTGPYVPKKPFKDKNGTIAWIVSHCDTKSKRERYVRELAKYIDIDIYGKCGDHVCRRYTDCMNKMSAKYKFYLSYENNMCKDYVTEKFFKPLQYDIVPIALGASNYSEHARPKSFVDTRDFRSPKDLADFLKKLSANQTAYEEYFQWKTKYKSGVSSRANMMCEICKVLTEGNYHKPAYKLSDWWKSIPCENNWVPDFLSRLKQTEE